MGATEGKGLKNLLCLGAKVVCGTNVLTGELRRLDQVLVLSLPHLIAVAKPESQTS